jgi:excisionase family DNA binding protein
MINTPMAMSPRDAARAIGISRSTLYRLIKQGRIRTVKLGRRTLVPTSALAELISEEVLP